MSIGGALAYGVFTIGFALTADRLDLSLLTLVFTFFLCMTQIVYTICVMGSIPLTISDSMRGQVQGDTVSCGVSNGFLARL